MKTATKHYITSFFFVLLFFGSFPQLKSQSMKMSDDKGDHFFEWADMPAFSSVLNTSLNVPDGGWIVGGWMLNPMNFIYPPVVFKLSETGEVLWQKTPMDYSWEVGSTDAMAITRAGDIIAAGNCMLGCDYGPPGVFVEKYSEDGQTLWQQILVSTEYIDYKVVGIFDLVNGETGILTDKVYYKLSGTGDSLLLVDYGFNYDERFSCGYADSNLLLMGHKKSIQVTDPDGVILSEHYFSETIRDISGYHNNYYILTEKRMLRTGKDLTVTDSVDLSEYLSDSTVNVFSDSLCVLVNATQIVRLDLNTFQVLETGYDKPEKFQVNDVAVSDTVLFLSGSSVFNLSKAFVAKTWSFSGHTEEHNLDIGITNIVVDNVRAEQDDYNPDVYNYFWNATAWVKNFGNEPVISCYITGKLKRIFICGYNVVFKPVTGIYLAPGDSVMIPLGEIADGPFFISDTNEVMHDFRLNTMLPNNKTDRNVNNDESEVIFHVPLGIVKNNFEKLNIYPNPSGNLISVQNAPRKSSWKLYSVSGKELAGGFTEQGEFSINVSGLIPGIYLLQVTGPEGSRVVRKIVVN